MCSAPSVDRPFGVPLLDDLPDPDGMNVLVRAALGLALSPDPATPLALARAEGLAATVRWLVERGARVTVWGRPAGAPLARVRTVLEAVEPALAGCRAVRLRTSAEEEGAVARMVHAHDLFVNDSLQDSRWPTPSVLVPPACLPSAAGRTLGRDLAVLEPFVRAPDRPFVAVLGGERTFQRLLGLAGLVLRADAVLLGGGLALPMLQALGREPRDTGHRGDGGAGDDFLWECRRVIGLSQRVRHRLVLPDDLVWAATGSAAVSASRRAARDRVVDIGPAARLRFAEELMGARCALWAGSVGRVEDERSRAGTRALAAALEDAHSVLLGGDALVDFLHREDLAPRGARVLSATDGAIELLKDGELPAISAIGGGRRPAVSG
jgi:3-phosphoglycerate kinase